jgi:hypothetical protein
MSKTGGGVVPFVTAGFPNGAGSAKEAVQMEIRNQNNLQAGTNMLVGGLQNKKMKARRSKARRSNARRSNARRSNARRTARHGSAKGARRTARHGSAKGAHRSAKGARRSKARRTARHGSAKGARRSNARRTARHGSAKGARRSNARRSKVRRIYKGGLDSDNNLIDGEQLAVPQFGPSVGPLNPNTASIVTNSLLLKAQQDSAFDKDISK